MHGYETSVRPEKQKNRNEMMVGIKVTFNNQVYDSWMTQLRLLVDNYGVNSVEAVQYVKDRRNHPEWVEGAKHEVTHNYCHDIVWDGVEPPRKISAAFLCLCVIVSFLVSWVIVR